MLTAALISSSDKNNSNIDDLSNSNYNHLYRKKRKHSNNDDEMEIYGREQFKQVLCFI